MQSLVRVVRSQCRISLDFVSSISIRSSNLISSSFDDVNNHLIHPPIRNFHSFLSERKVSHEWASSFGCVMPSFTPLGQIARFGTPRAAASTYISRRCWSTAADPIESTSDDATVPDIDVPSRIKFKRPDKTARHIMQILDKEAVEQVKAQREIPDIKPGYIIQLRLEVPENKRRVTTIKGIVIARRNAGLNTTFRLRRLVAGVGVESLLPLYSPNIKEIKVLDKKKVRRAKLYYLREKMNPLKK